MTLTHCAVAGALRHRRIPCAEEIGAERDHEARAREVDRRQLLAAKADRIGAAHALVAHRLEHDRRRRAELRRELGGQRRAAAAPRPRDERDRLLIARRRDRVQLADELADRFVPAHRREIAAAAIALALHRLGEAVGVIGDLYRRLAARAQAALADRILRLALAVLRDARGADAL